MMMTNDSRLTPWLAAVALATLAPHAPHLPPWLVAVSALCIAWSLWRWRQGAGALPRLPLLLLVVAGTAGILAAYRTIFGQEPGVALLALFMALKLLELRAPRDAVVVVMLGYFLLLTHYFNDESLLVGGWMLAAMIVVTAALVRLQSAAGPVLGTARQAAILVAQSLPMMLVLFVLFPRISGPLWGLPQDARKASTGLSDTMSPGSISDLAQSTAIAFRAQFGTALPPRNALYWRGPVMNDYDGRSWRAAGAAGRPDAPAVEARGAAFDYTLTLEAHQQRWLLALDLPLQAPPDAGFNNHLALVRNKPVRERLRYDARSVTDFRVNVVEQPAILTQSLQLPPRVNPRARALAAEWRAASGDAQVIAAKSLVMFREQEFIFTLQPPTLGEHAVDDFLFGSRRGFCEHYAGAFVFLMRAAGVPARVVAGYQGGEANPVDGYLTVRQLDAHAWAEIWIAGRGWQRVDPTAAIAPSRVEQGIAAALPASEALPTLIRGGGDWARAMLFRWEALNNAWNQWVLGYDAERQRSLLARFGLGADWRQMIAALAVLAGATMLAVGLWVLRSRPPADPAQRLWQRFCRRLGRLGVAREPWEGPLHYAQRASAALPTLADALARGAAAYARLRYGTPAATDLQTLRDALRALPRRSWLQRGGAAPEG